MRTQICLYSPDDAILRRLEAAWPADLPVRTVRTLAETCAALTSGARAAVCHASTVGLAELLDAARGAPIVLLAGDLDDAAVERALGLGAAEVLDLARLDTLRLRRAVRRSLARSQWSEPQETRAEAQPSHNRVAHEETEKLEAVGRLAGGIANDFNNLLEVILGCSGLARDTLDAKHPAHEDLARVQQAARKAAKLVRQLLTYSQRSHGAPQLVQVDRLVATMREQLERTIGPGISLEVLAPAPVGSVRVDPTQLEQLLLHLAANAHDAMPNGGRLTIEIVDTQVDAALAAWRSGLIVGPYVLLRVTDDGIGLDEVVKARLFEPFFTTKSTGTGMSLATCYGIVRQGGGVILVDSAPGCGATFSIYLPRIEA